MATEELLEYSDTLGRLRALDHCSDGDQILPFRSIIRWSASRPTAAARRNQYINPTPASYDLVDELRGYRRPALAP